MSQAVVPAGTRFVIADGPKHDPDRLVVVEGDPEKFRHADRQLACLCCGIPEAHKTGSSHGCNWNVRHLRNDFFEVVTRRDC